VPTASDVAYLDASALVKLVLPEDETVALEQALERWPRRATSRIAVVEVLRAVLRRDASIEPRARYLLTRLSLVAIADRLLLGAVAIPPLELRAIDALHIASALRIGRALAVFVSYDQRQLEAAAALGLPTDSPR
jgi:uncharacterized protein